MYTFDSRIRYSETDSEGKLTMASLLNYFQDCSTFQSEDGGLGISYMKEQGLVWVLSSWQIQVMRYPRLGERVRIGTHPYDFKGFLGYRNFCMMAEDGSYIARAASLWSLLDTERFKPVNANEDMRRVYVLEEKLPMDYAPRKIAVPAGGQMAEAILVRRHHLDTNHHVNNGQYVNMALELLEEKCPKAGEVVQMRAEYKKQAFLGDVLQPYVAREAERFTVSLQDGQGTVYVNVEFTLSNKQGL